jgi:hypothetical protein
MLKMAKKHKKLARKIKGKHCRGPSRKSKKPKVAKIKRWLKTRKKKK